MKRLAQEASAKFYRVIGMNQISSDVFLSLLHESSLSCVLPSSVTADIELVFLLFFFLTPSNSTPHILFCTTLLCLLVVSSPSDLGSDMSGKGSHSLSTVCPLPESFLSEVNVCIFVNTYRNNSEKIEESALRKVGRAGGLVN